MSLIVPPKDAKYSVRKLGNEWELVAKFGGHEYHVMTYPTRRIAIRERNFANR